jgi:hypothetical protein
MNALEPYITEWGADPLWKTEKGLPWDYVSDDMLHGFKTVRAGLRLTETAAAAVTVAGFQPLFDAERNLWYCDVHFHQNMAYFPFVKLALARFQPASLPGCELSPVAVASFVQLTPDRTASVGYSADSLRATVSVTGPGYSAGAATDSAGKPVVSNVLARLETRRAGLSEFAWTVFNDVLVKLTAQSTSTMKRITQALSTLPLTPSNLMPSITPPDPSKIADKPMMWSATITLPKSEVGYEYRLVIEEYERYPAYKADGTGAYVRENGKRLLETRERLVYADVLPITLPSV